MISTGPNLWNMSLVKLYLKEPFLNKNSLPLLPRAKPIISPIAEPSAATRATNKGLKMIPPATTVAIPGAGIKRVAEPRILTRNMPSSPHLPSPASSVLK